MSEPEDILSDAARHAYGAAQKLWGRRKDVSLPENETLAFNRRRLELFVSAIFDSDIPIRPSQPPSPPPFLRRLFGRPQRFIPKQAIPGSDGRSIYLPSRAKEHAALEPFQLFRLWAVIQGATVRRKSAQVAHRMVAGLNHLESQASKSQAGRLVYRDHGELSLVLFELSEFFCVLGAQEKELPGLRGDFASLRAAVLSSRPELSRLTPVEGLVDRWYRITLQAGAGFAVEIGPNAGPPPSGNRASVIQQMGGAASRKVRNSAENRPPESASSELSSQVSTGLKVPPSAEAGSAPEIEGELPVSDVEGGFLLWADGGSPAELGKVFAEDFLPPPLPVFRSPEQTAAWAQSLAAILLSYEESGRFRGFLRDELMGVLMPVEGRSKRQREGEAEIGEHKQQVVKLPRRPRVREAEEDEDDRDPGAWMMQMDDPIEHVEDPMGMQRPTDREAGENPGDVADSLSELDEARIVHTPERAKEVFESDDPPESRQSMEAGKKGKGIVYPEWDFRAGDYRLHGATVWLKTAELGDARWAAELREERRPLLLEVKRRFEGLRPRRVAQNRQSDGDELDLASYVQAHADWQAGVAAEDRFYMRELPQRRDLAVSLLVDISASTDAWVSEDLRIIDVEKEALLVCCHALDTLGDPYAIEAFSGDGPHGVRMSLVKDFSEREGVLVDRRIAALEPDNYTRAGAAIRHATARLAARKESKRLLLLLSDGKPNDLDEYGGQYGVEDMRIAVAEATAAGLHTFCLTVDRDAPAYLQQIFGPSRHTVLEHARELPTALVEVLRHLLR